jgi:hypothetical protein
VSGRMQYYQARRVRIAYGRLQSIDVLAMCLLAYRRLRRALVSSNKKSYKRVGRYAKLKLNKTCA